MENMYINHWAVLLSAVSILVVGALWYSPLLFYKVWMKENNFTEETVKQKFNPLKMYGISLLMAIIISYNLAFFLGDEKTTAVWGATAGFLAGFGFSAMIFTVIALFEQRTFKYILLNCGFIIVYFTLAGFIIGAWR